eukprot:TRINITY_DN5772_c0_g1_i2.p1 TRINITY_DN5772_c0_g1~~TRINITY_DN5772_c0_g1_i2.p1  ORF type:complete len:272 (+),score=75.86 TRINITY_DN5772_c0_g1_i2:115-930(+)
MACMRLTHERGPALGRIVFSQVFSTSPSAGSFGVRSLASRSNIVCQENQGLFSKFKQFVSGNKTEEQAKDAQLEKLKAELERMKAQQAKPNPEEQKLREEAQKFADQLPKLETLGKETLDNMTEADASTLQQRLLSGKFDLNDMRAQLLALDKMGSMAEMASKIPGLGSKLGSKMPQISPEDRAAALKTQLALIDAMTPDERRNPTVLTRNAFARKSRIIQASGQNIEALNKLLEMYFQMKTMYGKMSDLKAQGKPLPSSFEDMAKLIMKR